MPIHPQGFPVVMPTDEEILALDAAVDWEAQGPALQRFGEAIRATADVIRRERAADRKSSS